MFYLELTLKYETTREGSLERMKGGLKILLSENLCLEGRRKTHQEGGGQPEESKIITEGNKSLQKRTGDQQCHLNR